MLVTPAVQDILASKFASELAYGVDDYPDGVSTIVYGGAAQVFLANAKLAGREGRLTFADLMLGQLYTALATEDPEELRRQVTCLVTQGLQWREALDKRQATQ